MNISNFDKYKPILNGSKNVAEWGRENGQTRQYAHQQVQIFLDAAKESKEYKDLVLLTTNEDGKNFIKKLECKSPEWLLIFKYINKKNIFDFGENDVFYSSISKDDLNEILRDTLSDMYSINIKQGLEANNIDSDEDFIYHYEKNSLLTDLKLKPLDMIESELVKYGKPMEKTELFDIASKMGIKKSTVTNILGQTTNHKDKIVNLGTMVCDRDVFFNKYIDVEVANKFILASVAICEQNDICTTDIKWLKNKIQTAYPDINVDAYNLHELKAILCSESQFKRDVKFNVIYLDKQCQFAPSNINELVEKILEEYELPVSFGFLVEKINDNGKDFGKATLASHILPNDPNVSKINQGWVLTKKIENVEKFYSDAKALNIDAKKIVEQLKTQFKVVTFADLAKKMGVPLPFIQDYVYGSTNFEYFTMRLNEYKYKITISGNKLNISK